MFVPYLAEVRGFLPTRGSFMLDFVFTAMIGIIVIMAVSILLVRFQRKYQLHKRIQITLGIVLLFAVGAFEIDMRFFTNWRELAAPSRFYASGTVFTSLCIHLAFAIPTPFVWAYVIVAAMRRFPKQVVPNEYSPRHIIWARLAAILMTLTALTGWVFYVLAFVC